MQQHISKKLGQGHVYPCVASSLLLTTVSKCLATEETSFWTFGRGLLSHSWSDIGLQMLQMFSVDEMFSLQAGQSSTWTPPLRSHTVVIDAI